MYFFASNFVPMSAGRERRGGGIMQNEEGGELSLDGSKGIVCCTRLQ